MATGTIAVAAVGTALSLEAQRQQNKEIQRAAKETAGLLKLDAQERLDRSVINQKVISQEGKQFASQQLVELAGSGVDISEGTSLSILEDTRNQVLKQQNIEKQLAEFEAASILRQADEQNRKAEANRKAAPFRTAATIFQGIAAGSK